MTVEVPETGVSSVSSLVAAPAATSEIGSLVRARRGLRTEIAVVLDRGPDNVEVAWPSGEVSWIPTRRIKEQVLPSDVDVRSVPGRLIRLVNSTGVKSYLTPEASATVRSRVDVLAAEREHAVGLLLDRASLSWGLDDCLALKIEPWRVRYEFLAEDATTEDASALADAIVMDASAPAAVRVLLALRYASPSVREYLCGDEVSEAVLPVEQVAELQSLKSALFNPECDGVLADAIVDELVAILRTDGGLRPSERLLEDRSLWHILLAAEVSASPPSGPHGEEFAGISALLKSRKALFDWEWDQARSIAREGLRHSRREAVRDELLNVIAATLWMEGEPLPALAALDSALEGAYTDALLINASTVATELEHDSAVERLVKLAREAPSAHQRAVAAERALVLWTNDDNRVWDEVAGDSLPPEIRDALRPLICEDLPEERYIRVLRVLANRDDDWLARQPDAAFGPNVHGSKLPVVRIFRALAEGLEDYAKALTFELNRNGSQAWVAEERDSVVSAATGVLFERNDELGAAFFGLTLLDANLPMSAEQRIPLKCLTVASIAANIDPHESEPNLRFIDHVVEADREQVQLRSSGRVDAGELERLRALVQLAAEALARAYFVSRYRQFDDVIEAYNSMITTLSGIPSRRLNMHAVRQSFGPISQFCRETYDIFARLRPLITDPELTEAVVAMMTQSSEMGNRIAEVTR